MWYVWWRDNFFGDVDIFVPVCILPPRPNSFSFRAKVKQSKGVAGWQPTSRFLVVRTMRSDGALQPIAHAESFQCLVYGAKSWPTYLSLMPQRYSTYENAKLVSSYDNYPSSWSRGKSTIPARRSSRRLSRNPQHKCFTLLRGHFETRQRLDRDGGGE